MDRICDILRSVRVHIMVQPFWPTLRAWQVAGFKRGRGHAVFNVALGPIGFSVMAIDAVELNRSSTGGFSPLIR